MRQHDTPPASSNGALTPEVTVRLGDVIRALHELQDAERGEIHVAVHDVLTHLRHAVIQLGEALSRGVPLSVATLDRVADSVHGAVCAAYDAAGRPAGPRDEDMWCWFEQLAAIAAEGERRSQERLWQYGLRALQYRRWDRPYADD